MFNKNYFDLEELIKTSCSYCGIVIQDKNYSQIVSLCTKYFWGNIYKPDFENKINLIKENVNNE